MPVEVKDIKAFLEIARRKNAQRASLLLRHTSPDRCGIDAIVKKSLSRKPGSASKTKFKIRCTNYLYTLTVLDQEKAEKLRQSLPPSQSRSARHIVSSLIPLLTALNVKEVDKKSNKKKAKTS